VAPSCNVQCNYCNRKFDCLNESRPGVTSVVLRPAQAITYLDRAIEKLPNLSVVGIAGPGDPFASPDETLETLWRVRARYPEMLLCVASNGLNLLPYVDKLARLQVSHVTLTVNAVDPAVSARIYAWVRDGKKIYCGEAGAALLLARQRRVIAELHARGIVVKINTIVVPGINDTQIKPIAVEMRGLGVDIMNCIPIYPVEDTPFASLPSLPPARVAEIRETAGRYLPQMNHCTRCRADAVGLLGAPQSRDLVELMQACARGSFTSPDQPYVAVASMEGLLVNQHLGEAVQLWIYEPAADGPRLMEKRATPEPGAGDDRWRELADRLQDCRALLVGAVGRNPRRVLEEEGVTVIEMTGLISEGLMSFVRTGAIPATMRREFKSCGSACQGSGMGCG
jgi:nitrogen fixation protein NifB